MKYLKKIYNLIKDKILHLILLAIAAVTVIEIPIMANLVDRISEFIRVHLFNFDGELGFNRSVFATFFGIGVAFHFAKVQMQKRAVFNIDHALRNHMISVSDFVKENDAKMGIYYEYTEEHKYAVMWRVLGQKRDKPDNYKLVLLFRIFSPESRVEEEIIDGCIFSWWDHKTVIARFGERHGVVIESYNEKRTNNFISHISDKSRTDIMRAMKCIQILDEKEIKDCEKRLSDSFLNDISDNYLIKLERKSIPTAH